MNKKFTQNNLIRYHYNELDLCEREEMEKEMNNDPDLLAESRMIQQTMRLLDLEKRNPSFSSIRIILNHSRSSNTELKAFL